MQEWPRENCVVLKLNIFNRYCVCVLIISLSPICSNRTHSEIDHMSTIGWLQSCTKFIYKLLLASIENRKLFAFLYMFPCFHWYPMNVKSKQNYWDFSGSEYILYLKTWCLIGNIQMGFYFYFCKIPWLSVYFSLSPIS